VARARSGDKGGTANVGVWARDDAAAEWLAAMLTREKVRELLPEADDLPITVQPAAEPVGGQRGDRRATRP
jgi:hypothetical protein